MNARIRELDERLGCGAGPHDLFCECGTPGCLDRMEVPGPAYVDVEGSGDRFLVAPGHQHPRRDHVLEAAPGYLVVALRSPASRGTKAIPGVLAARPLNGAG